MKIDKHEIWQALTQLTLRCLKYIKGNFSLHAVWHSCFLIHPQSFYRERENRWRKSFSCSENAIWSILFKYQEIDVQIQTFTDKN